MIATSFRRRIDHSAQSDATLMLDLARGAARKAGNAVSLRSLLTTARAQPGPGISANGPLSLIPANTPRFILRPEGGGLVSERATRNLLVQGGNLAAAPWTRGNGAQAYTNTAIAADGTLTACQCIDTAAAGSPAGTWEQTIAISSATQFVVLSALIRPRSGRRIRLYLGLLGPSTVTGGYTTFDLVTGCVIASEPAVIARIERAPLGMLRLIVTVNNTIGGTAAAALITRESDAASPITFEVDRVQFEVGSRPTLPLKPDAGVVSRDGDVVSVDLTGADASTWFNPAAGTIVADAILRGPSAGTQTVFSLAGPGATFMTAQRVSGDTINAVCFLNGAVQAFGSAAGVVLAGIGRRVRVAIRYGQGAAAAAPYAMIVGGGRQDYGTDPYSQPIINMATGQPGASRRTGPPSSSATSTAARNSTACSHGSPTTRMPSRTRT